MKSNYIKNLNRSAYLQSPKDNIQIPFYHKKILREKVTFNSWKWVIVHIKNTARVSTVLV